DALTCNGNPSNPDFPTWTANAGSNEAKPISCVNWWQAYAFCIWDGGFLPAILEWEYAAAGGSQERIYPWGSDSPTYDHAVYHCAGASGPSQCLAGDLLIVGSRPDGNGRWGHADLSGSMYEFMLEHYAGWLMVAGGGWGTTEISELEAGYMTTAVPSPTITQIDLGFRCARSP